MDTRIAPSADQGTNSVFQSLGSLRGKGLIIELYILLLVCMEAFELTPPDWTKPAAHASEFCCPACRSSSKEAKRVWVNRRSPVYTEDHRRKWQEFYECQCEQIWWAWSSDRPPSELANKERDIPPPRFFNPFDDL